MAELKLVVGDNFLALLNEAKVLFGSVNQVEALERALKVAVEQKKKLLEQKMQGAPTPPAESFDAARHSRYIPREILRAVWGRASARCEYTGGSGRCNSQHKLQYDHIRPLALGGATELTNLRLLCQAHNLAEARRLGLRTPT